MKVRCGNHGRGVKVYHETVQDVKACYATHISSPKRAEDAREDKLECEGHESLDGAHMGKTVYCDGSCRKQEKRDVVHPRSSGWWNLPIAASMWRADARATER